MNHLSKLALGVCVFAMFAGCRGRAVTVQINYTDTLYHPQYAEYFDIFAAGKSSVISIYDPWPSATGVRSDLFLSRSNEEPPAGFEGMVVKAPLKRVICMSSSHRAFISELGQTESIKGISGAKYVYDKDVRYMVEMGKILDVGYDTGIDYELIASLEPDIVFLYGISSESPAAQKLREMGINSIHIGEFKEVTPLGKAEWLVAFGEMFDLRHGAQREFSTINRYYNELAATMQHVDNRPVVMLNAPLRDTWYIPGDNSYMVQLINDAGGQYVAKGEDARFSRPVGLEAAWMMAEKSDYWLNPNNAASMAEVLDMNPKFGEIPPVLGGRVYNNNRRGTAHGGSDFWESGAVRPDIILRDIIRILHSDTTKEDELFYFHKLE